MADEVTSIASGFQARMATITGLNCYASPPDNVNFPGAYVDGPLPGTNYERVLGGGASYLFHIIVAVSISAGMANGVALVRPYLARTGAQSIIAAVEADATLGGACDDLIVDSAGYQSAQHAATGDQLLVGEWRVRVHASGAA